MRADFSAAHRTRFGIEPPGAQLVVEAIRAQASGDMGEEYRFGGQLESAKANETPTASEVQTVFEGRWTTTSLCRRADLAPGQAIEGPAIIAEDHATTVVPPGWQAAARPTGHLVLTRTRPRNRVEAGHERPDPILLEVFNNRFMHIAEQMGAVLENTAHSGQYQGTPGFLLRPVRFERRTGGQRPAHAGASRIHGRQRASRPEVAQGRSSPR